MEEKVGVGDVRPHLVISLPILTGLHRLKVSPDNCEHRVIHIVVIEESRTFCKHVDLYILQSLAPCLSQIFIDTA